MVDIEEDIRLKETEILEIATSLVGGALTLFIGTGFSKHMTNDRAPSWSKMDPME
ncbi:hypothetical protein JCM14036_11120 [Desulfotomaculum defluvii]